MSHLGQKWPKDELKELLTLWKKYDSRLEKNKNNSPVFKLIAQEINENLGLECKITEADVFKKIVNLKKQYRYVW